MKRKILRQNRFKKDYKKLKKKGIDLQPLRDVIELLASGEEIPEVYRDHSLNPPLANYRDLHIDYDWILLYRLEKDTVVLVRTGTHMELFQPRGKNKQKKML